MLRNDGKFLQEKQRDVRGDLMARKGSGKQKIKFAKCARAGRGKTRAAFKAHMKKCLKK